MLRRSCSKTVLDAIVFLLFVPVRPVEPEKIGRKGLAIIFPYTLSGYYPIARSVSQKESARALFWDIEPIQVKGMGLFSINSQSGS